MPPSLLDGTSDAGDVPGYGTRPMRWGVIGTGTIASQFARDLLEHRGMGPMAVLSRSVQSARRFGEAHKVPADGCTDDFERFASLCDVVYVATPHTRHHPDTMRCLKASRHVLVEKPMAATPEEAQEMMDEALARGCFLMEALWTRFLPASVELRARLPALGPVRSIDVDHGFDGAGAPDRLMDPALGGGSWLDLGSYVLNFASEFLGAAAPTVRAPRAKVSSGADLETTGVLVYPAPGGGEVHAGFRTSCERDTSNVAFASCERGSLTVHAPYHHPTRFSINGQEFSFPLRGHGLWYQTLEVEACIKAGKKQSNVVPWELSASWAASLESVRRACGMDPLIPVDKRLARLRVAVIGCGRIGQCHSENLRALGVGTVIEIDVEDPLPSKGEVDAVVVASPSNCHHEHLRLAIELGVPAYCEKPLCDTLEASAVACRELAAAGCRVHVGFQRRFDPAFMAVEAQAKRLGGVRSLSIISRDPSPPPAAYLAKMGSHYADMTIHDLDEARWLLGEEPCRVYATLDSAKHKAVVVLTGPSGRQCTITNDRFSAIGYDQRVEVVGERGVALHAELPRDPKAHFQDRYRVAYRLAMRDFLMGPVLEGREPSVTARDALAAAVLANACDESAEKGCEVAVPTLDEVLGA